MIMNLELLGDDSLVLLKKAEWFPFFTGNLKFHATRGELTNSKTYIITFDSKIAPYVEALEEGSKPHDIPGAFGRDFPFGLGGKFNGKFHPGSTKHKGFIKDKSVQAIIKHICDKYNGELK